MNAKSIKGKSTAEFQVALEHSLADGFTPTLAIVFISINQDRKAITQLLLQNNMDVFGYTSCGEFIDGHQSEGGIAILLLDIKRENYTIFIEDVKDSKVDETASIIAQKAKNHFENPTLLLSSNGVYDNGKYFDGNTLINTLVKELGDDCIFFGGMAGDDWEIQNSCVFTNHKETTSGIAALVFDANYISLQGIATHGWKPLGITRKITKSAGNMVYSIDGQPAAEMYLKYLGMIDKNKEENFDIFRDLSVHYPFIAKRENGETIIKSPRAIDKETNALLMDIDMEEGSEFQFSTPPDFEISKEIIAEATNIKNTIEPQPDAMLIFSCAGRPPVLGPLTTLENDGLAAVWQVPMAGFYTYGEFGRMKNGKQHFHSGVCCWVTITEKYSSKQLS
jgi:hypothetical protein